MRKDAKQASEATRVDWRACRGPICLPFRFAGTTTPDMSPPRTSVIGYHLIWTLYGHWLANDLRGSGSEDVRDPKFAPLGTVHRGRKPEHLQPSRAELKEFFRKAQSAA